MALGRVSSGGEQRALIGQSPLSASKRSSSSRDDKVHKKKLHKLNLLVKKMSQSVLEIVEGNRAELTNKEPATRIKALNKINA